MGSAVDHAQSKMPLEGVEVPVAVQQAQPVGQAARSDENVDRPTHGQTQASQLSVVSGCLNGKIGAADGHLLQLSEQAPGFIEALDVLETLPDLCQYQVTNEALSATEAA